jgi:hypothetical protein
MHRTQQLIDEQGRYDMLSTTSACPSNSNTHPCPTQSFDPTSKQVITEKATTTSS